MEDSVEKKCIDHITLLWKAEQLMKDEKMSLFKQDYKNFFDDKIYTDFEIKTSDGETLTAHKAILAARSPWFYAMLKPETGGTLAKYSEFDSKIMKELFRFVYYKKVENLNEIAAVLIHAADKYQIKDLKESCIESLSKTITHHNVLGYFVIADRLSDIEKLYDKCLETFISNYRQVKQSEEWKNLSVDLKLKILHETFGRTNEQATSSTALP